MNDRTSQRFDVTLLLSPLRRAETDERFELNDFLPYALHRLINTWQSRFSARLEFLGLTFETWRILLVASETGLKNIRSLSEATFIPYSTLQRWLDRMETNGLIERRTLEDDARSVEILLTDKGRQLFSDALPISLDDCSIALSGFSPLEYHALLDFLRRLQENISIT